ncbi:MAG: acyl-CoA desaturase [Mycobacteriales bacterium]|nr:MAG: acyl-CoA desaturase [Pseudonocardiales bacterium]
MTVSTDRTPAVATTEATASGAAVTRPSARSEPKPIVSGRRSSIEQGALYFFVIAPFLAVVAAIPVAWGWGLGWHDVVLFVAFYLVSGFGVTMGFHRYFTHGAFKAKRALKIAMGIAGSMSIEGPVIRWVADHRRHHAYSDREGDPHSPWRYGETTGALAKGLYHAHTGWMFDREKTNKKRFTPDLLRDPDIARIDKYFPFIMLVSFFGPVLAGGLWSMSWQGALSAFFWATLVRICVLHHITWSINSICHTIGERPFAARDKSANFWPLAIASLGESWHNSHHADPTAARHGVLRWQLDSTARLIRWAEHLHLVYDVRWPSAERIASKLVVPPARGSAAG